MLLAADALARLNQALTKVLESISMDSTSFGAPELVQKKAQEAEILFQGYAKAKPSGEDAYAAAREFVRGKTLDDWQRDVVASALTEKIRESGDRSVLECDRFPELLAEYEEEAKRQDLEARLSKAGLNISKPVSWYLRGGKSKLEIKRPPTVIKKSAWSMGAVRDCEVNLVDAVADLRWLRSRVAAHDLDSLVSGLSVHDVANAQELARGALLSSMGFNTETIPKLYHQFEFL